MSRAFALTFCVVLLAAGPAPASPVLERGFACVREGGALVAAHRGGSGPGRPENALSTMQRTAREVTPLMETDVSVTADGVLVLFHDADLDRKTTGAGPIARTPWEVVRRLRLKDEDGRVTAVRIGTLDDALRALRGRAVLQLDRKRPAAWADILRTVEREGAQDSVIAISYSREEALEIARLAPWVLVSASLDSIDDLDALEAGGLPARRILAWTGNRQERPALWRALQARGVTVIFGTLGARDTRLDTLYQADGDPSEYRTLVRSGVDVISSSTPAVAVRAIGAADARACFTLRR